MKGKLIIKFARIIVLAASLVMLFNSNCSAPARHNVLSFFFDGVPEPQPSQVTIFDSVKIDKIAGKPDPKKNIAVNTPFYFHPGILEKSCEDCHDKEAGYALTELQPDLCYGCHEDFSDTYQTVHGPAAGGFCTECHNIHQSKNEKLLVRISPPLCLHCHDSQDVFKSETHEGIEDSNCMDCHNPHGSDSEYLLK